MFCSRSKVIDKMSDFRRFRDNYRWDDDRKYNDDQWSEYRNHYDEHCSDNRRTPLSRYPED